MPPFGSKDFHGEKHRILTPIAPFGMQDLGMGRVGEIFLWKQQFHRKIGGSLTSFFFL
jgi:hypothetical protein